MTKQIEAYQTSDGQIFLEESIADSHQEDIIGEMLDDLVANDARGNVTRSDRHSILMTMIKDPQLKNKIAKLHHALTLKDED
tara:strand:+ start:4832 stop:5077 length:246 start_codon:yes stop_codon:yes gene_type:complete